MKCKNIIFPADLADWRRKIIENLRNLRETSYSPKLNEQILSE
jgi:hypothetical protein